MKSNSIQTRKHIFILALALLVISFFSINLVSSQEETIEIGTFKQYQCVNLIQDCSNCSYVNLTFVQYPNSTYSLLTEAVMTKNGTIYTYNYCLTSALGDYKYGTKGDLDGTITTQPIRFTITTTGSSKIAILPLILLIAGYLLLVLGLWQKEYILGFASGTLLVISGVYFLIYGLGLFNDLYTKTIAYVSLFIGLIVSFASAYEFLPEREGSWSDEE